MIQHRHHFHFPSDFCPTSLLYRDEFGSTHFTCFVGYTSFDHTICTPEKTTNNKSVYDSCTLSTHALSLLGVLKYIVGMIWPIIIWVTLGVMVNWTTIQQMPLIKGKNTLFPLKICTIYRFLVLRNFMVYTQFDMMWFTCDFSFLFLFFPTSFFKVMAKIRPCILIDLPSSQFLNIVISVVLLFLSTLFILWK